jgi:hypothetical protein
MPVNAHLTTLAFRSAKCLALHFDTIHVVLRYIIDVWSGYVRTCTPMPRTPLVCLSIQQEVTQYPARAPEKSICPPFDPAFVFIKNKDRPGRDHFTL